MQFTTQSQYRKSLIGLSVCSSLHMHALEQSETLTLHMHPIRVYFGGLKASAAVTPSVWVLFKEHDVCDQLILTVVDS